MRKQVLAGAMAVVLAMGMTTSAMAFGHGGGHGGGFHGGFAGSRGSFAAMRGGNFAGVRGFSGWRHGAWGSRRAVGGYGGGYGPYYDDGGIDVGLGLLGLGVGLANGGYGYCSPYDYNYGYCGPSFVVGR